MAVPSPVVPSFVDGTVLSASALNALGANITNLWNDAVGKFNTQRPMVLAVQTTGQAFTSGAENTVSFNSAPINTDNMWIASNNTQITINTAGIYLLAGQTRFGVFGGATLGIIARASILVNGTSAPSSAVNNADVPFMTAGNGPAPLVFYLSNLAAGATVFLNCVQNTGATQNTQVNLYGGCFLGAVWLAPAS